MTLVSSGRERERQTQRGAPRYWKAELPRDIAACLILVLTLVVVLWKALLGLAVVAPSDIPNRFVLPLAAPNPKATVWNSFGNDAIVHRYPSRLVIRDSLRQGELPVWTPLEGAGFPFMADSMAGVLDPANLLHLLMHPVAAYGWGIFLQLLVAGVGMFAYVRVLGLGRTAALIGGLAYMLNGQFLNVLTPWMPAQLMWLPVALLLLHLAVSRARFELALLSGLALGLGIVSGSVQVSFFLVFAVAAIVGVQMGGGTPGLPHRRLALYAALAVSVGVAIAAIQLVPAAELILLDRSAKLRSGNASFGAFSKQLPALPFLVTFAIPWLAGSPQSIDLTKLAGTSLMSLNGYIGFLPFFLAALAVVSRNRQSRPFVVLAAVVLVLVLATPLVRFLYQRFLVIYIFAAAILAAYGMEALLEDRSVRERARRMAVGFSVATGLVVVLLLSVDVVRWWGGGPLGSAVRRYVLASTTEHLYGFARHWWTVRADNLLTHFSILHLPFVVAVPLVVASLLLVAALAQGRLPKNVFAVLAIGLTVVDLAFYGYQSLTVMDARKFPPAPKNVVMDRLRKDRSLFRLLVPRTAPGKPVVLFPVTYALAYGVPTLQDYQSMSPRRPSDIPQPFLESPSKIDALLRLRVLDALNVKYLMVPAATSVRAAGWERVISARGVEVYRNGNVLPRAYLVHRSIVLPTEDDVLARLRSQAFDPRDGIVFQAADSREPMEFARDERESQPTISRYTPTEVEIEVRALSPGYLVLSDTYYPGWDATVDGKRARIVRANYAGRSVFVSQGRHHVKFTYRPRSVAAGMGVSAAMLTLVTISSVGIVIRRRATGSVTAG